MWMFPKTKKTYISTDMPDYAVVNLQVKRLQEIKQQIEALEKEKDSITASLFKQKKDSNYETTIIVDETQATFCEGFTYSASEQLFDKLKEQFGLDSEYFKHTVNTEAVNNSKFANELTVKPKKAYITLKKI